MWQEDPSSDISNAWVFILSFKILSGFKDFCLHSQFPSSVKVAVGLYYLSRSLAGLESP